MADDLVWTLGARHPGHDYKIFKTSFIEGSHEPTGKSMRFSMIECVDWVNVIALTPDEQVVLIRQYRPGVNDVCLEIPGGMVDDGEDAASAAARELVEETGYTSTSWRVLGSVSPNPAIQTNRLHCFLALDAIPTSAPRLEGNEVLCVETRPLRDVQQLLRAGAIDHALVVAAFGFLSFGLGELRRP